MPISGLDLNLIPRAGAGRRGPVVVVAADTICASHAAGKHAPRVVRNQPYPDVDPTEGCPLRPSGSSVSGYGGARLEARAGARLDLLC